MPDHRGEEEAGRKGGGGVKGAGKILLRIRFGRFIVRRVGCNYERGYLNAAVHTHTLSFSLSRAHTHEMKFGITFERVEQRMFEVYRTAAVATASVTTATAAAAAEPKHITNPKEMRPLYTYLRPYAAAAAAAADANSLLGRCCLL